MTTTVTSMIVDPSIVAEIRLIEKGAGRTDLFSDFVRRLEASVWGFRSAFQDYVVKGDATGAARAAHTLKGSSRQLGAQALGDLFADIERHTKAGDYAEAQRAYDDGADLIKRSLEALKHA
jgi:HPt (histidine-containing phosphotransfer) domain-containing protein